MRHSDDGRRAPEVGSPVPFKATICPGVRSRYGTPAGVISKPSATRAETFPDLLGTSPAASSTCVMRTISARSAGCGMALLYGSLGVQRKQARARGGRNAAFGDDAGDQPGGRDVESRVRDRTAWRDDGHFQHAAVLGETANVGDLAARALLDRDARDAVGQRPVDGRPRQ